ncbi:hypothetical protein ACIBPB_03775 [Micromonospora sp. NPDC049836]|uniref:hypothetical protein n=1 Tax=Micromonospora sp. NPDC049836 TaxID=3364274 RepID=UPI0037A53A12
MTERADQLRDAVLSMAIRYAEARQDYAYTLNAHADVRARHLRAMHRRLIALSRLTRALANLSGGPR